MHPVRVLTSEEEALRDVVRAREAIRGDLMRARLRLSKLLLRHDLRYKDTASAWTVAHRGWLTSIDLGELDAQFTLHLDGLSHAEIAMRLAIPAGTVKGTNTARRREVEAAAGLNRPQPQPPEMPSRPRPG